MLFCDAEHPIVVVGRLLFLVPFFVIHYGGFCAVHGVFVLALTHVTGDAGPLFPQMTWWGPLVFVQLLVGVIRQLAANAGPQLLAPVSALIISHGISFVQNYLGGRKSIERMSNRRTVDPLTATG